MFGRRTTEVGMDMARTGGAAIRIASSLPARVASPTMTSSNGGGRSSERRGSSPQARDEPGVDRLCATARSHTRRVTALIVSALPVRELVGFFRELGPELRMAIECEPLLH